MNSVSLTGRLGKDPELRKTDTGISWCSVSIAVSRDIKPKDGEPDSDWISIQLWRQTAEYICDYAEKGDLIGVSGKLRTRSRTAQDGSKRYVTEVLADHAEICGSRQTKSASSGTGTKSGKSRKSPAATKTQQLRAATPEEIARYEFETTGEYINPEDLPF